MTHPAQPDLLHTVLQLLTTQGSSSLAEGFRLLLNEAMSQERSAALQAQPYRRCEQRLGHANGFKPKLLATRVGQVQLRVPQVRDGIDFYPSALEKGVRSEQALMLAMAEMYVQGVSTRKVSRIIGELCGHQVSSAQVSACAARLDSELQLWRDRPLGLFSCVICNARYEKVRHGGILVDCAMLVAMGTAQGARALLFQNGSQTCRRMEENIPEGFTVYALPEAHHRRLRTSNAIERVNQELKRRTRVASLFPNEASLLRLATALLCELSNEWLTGKIYPGPAGWLRESGSLLPQSKVSTLSHPVQPVATVQIDA